MMHPRPELLVICLALLVAAVTAAQSNSSSAEETKDKRTREDIMFGNQQNKPAAIMEDLLGAESKEINDTVKEEEMKKNIPEDSPDYAGFLPPVAPAEDPGYGLVDPQILYDMPDLGDYPPYDVTNALFRRKRQLTRTPRAAFRSSLGQLMGRRLSRSAFRAKRQAMDRDAYYLLEQMPLGYGMEESPELGYNEGPEEPEQAAPSPLWFLAPQRRAPVPWYPPDLRYVRLPAKRGWGRFQPEPDMARLYALANLLADTEQPDFRAANK